MTVTELFKTDNVPADAEMQLTESGQLRHLLTLNGLGREAVTGLLDDAATTCSRPRMPRPAGA